jgi:hypothetical protein
MARRVKKLFQTASWSVPHIMAGKLFPIHGIRILPKQKL